MSSIMKGIMKEEESVSVLYVDGEPLTKYPSKAEAEHEMQRMKKKFPNKTYEIKAEVREGKDDPCWKGYKQIGMKKKGKKEVPNCVPVKEANSPAQQAAIAVNMKKKGKKPKQIDEISGGKIGEYIPQARDEKNRIQKKINKDTATNKEFRKGMRRAKGISNGMNKLLGTAKVPATVNESLILSTTKYGNPKNPEVQLLGGGALSYETLKRKALREAKLLAEDIERGEYKNSAINVKQLANTLNTIVAVDEELEKMYFGENADYHDEDLNEIADTNTDLNKTGGFIKPEHDNAYARLKTIAPKVYAYIRNEAPVPLDPVLTLRMFQQIRNEDMMLRLMKQELAKDTVAKYDANHPSLAESINKFWRTMINEVKKRKTTKESSVMKGLKRR